ncbi:MAG TPA: hypothetical protein VGO52_00835 [Hyphomonadaceae bacterium]|jgi:hypothetical protein|nr:hypothetical protein [Hyphomonadaceae bacterium]
MNPSSPIRVGAALLAAVTVATGTPAGASPPPPAAPAKVEDPGAKRITGSENYVPTFGLRASITRGREIHGVLTVDAGIDVPNEKMRTHVEAVRPRLMNSMREVVLNYASLSYGIGEKPDADMIRVRLQKAVDTVLGKDQAKVALASVIVFPK